MQALITLGPLLQVLAVSKWKGLQVSTRSAARICAEVSDEGAPWQPVFCDLTLNGFDGNITCRYPTVQQHDAHKHGYWRRSCWRRRRLM